MTSQELYRKIYDVIKPFRWKFVINLGFIAIVQSLFICNPLAMGLLIDSITKKKPWTIAVSIVAVMVGLRATIFLFVNLRNKFEIKYLDFDFPEHLLTLRRFDQVAFAQSIARAVCARASSMGWYACSIRRPMRWLRSRPASPRISSASPVSGLVRSG